MLRTSTVLIAAISLAAAPAYAETKKQKKERQANEAKEKADAEAAAAAEAEAAAAAEKAAAEAAAQPDAGGGGTVDASGGTGTGEAALPDAGTAVAGSWSQQIIKRPLNLLKGMIRVDASTGFARVFDPGSAGPPVVPSSTATVIPLSIGAGYGISDKLEAGINYGLTLKPFEAKGPLALYGLFNLTHSEKMRVSAGAAFGFASIPDGPGISAGLAFQYHLNEKMMVFMTPSHLNMGLDPFTLSINLPVGFGFQVNEKIFAQATTNLFNLNLKPSGGHTFIFADATPLEVGGFFSPSNKMDIGAFIGTKNLPDIADAIAISVVARLYFGKVPGGGAAAMDAATAPAADATPPPME